MLVTISWKNIWRSKVRSLVIIAAIVVGLWGGVFSIAFLYGMAEQRIESSLNYETSHFQIHNPNYLKNKEPKYLIKDHNYLIDKIKSLDSSSSFSCRHKIVSMASTSRGSAGVVVNAVNPKSEMKVLSLHKRIVENGGTYFNGKKNQIFISTELAYKLKMVSYSIDELKLQKLDIPQEIIESIKTLKFKRSVNKGAFKDIIKSTLEIDDFNKYFYQIEKGSAKFSLRKKIVLTFQKKSGELSGAAFRICGLFKSTNSSFDKTNVFINQKDFVRLSGYSFNEIHEIVCRLSEKENIENVVSHIDETTYYKAQAWYDISPELKMISQYMDVFLFIFIGIIIFALAFGILNTMLMAILERTKEIGMLMAIGMGKFNIFLMIMLETLFLSLVGSVVGMILAYFTVTVFSKVGIDLSNLSAGLESIGYNPVVYPFIENSYYLYISLMVSITAIIASIYPALKALSLKPANAIRME